MKQRKSKGPNPPPKSVRHLAAAMILPDTPEIPEEVRLISRKEVLRRVGLSYPTIWGWMRTETFPRGRNVGGKVAWIESEVSAWIKARPVNKLKGIGAEPSADEEVEAA